MPIFSFFGTRADLMPGLELLQKERPLQFVRCTAGGWLDSSLLPTYTSLLDAANLDQLEYGTWPVRRDIDRLDLIVFYVLDADAPVAVEERHIGGALPDGGTIRYRVAIPEDVPWVMLTPGGLQAVPRVLWCGELQAAYTDAAEIRLYRQIVDALFKGFKQFEGYFYGPEALALGAAGVAYAYMMREPYMPWTHAELLQREQNTPSLPDKPENGRLSLEESWNWLEAAGYEVPRNADGTPHPCRRRPKYDDAQDEGLNFFRTFIDEASLDHLMIPRTYIGKSCSYQTSFRQSDLSNSRLAANQFAYCDFTATDLSGAYLADFFLGCKFEEAVLTKADLRWASFENCSFARAKMTGTKLRSEQAQEISLSEEQRAEIAWHKVAGPEPPEF